jgi:molybdopterin molybdotransferase
LISVEEALEKVLSNIQVLGVEERPVLDCLGQVLAEDIYSEINVPPLDNSAMDGYAVLAKNTKGATRQNPRILKVIDTVIAGGISALKVKPGTAIRIMTGAPVPAGADAVVQFEHTDDGERKASPSPQANTEVAIFEPEEKGSNIRLTGESVAKGQMVVAKGAVIRPSEIGVIASLGRNKVRVIRRPVVAILATGDELVELGKALPDGKIYNSNSYSVAAQVIREGGVPQLLGIALDNEASVAEHFRKGMDADILLTIGGVSMGDYDVVKNVLAKQGEIVFWKVRSKPGKPLAFSTLKGRGKGNIEKQIPHVGLAGNSVSCMVNFELFVRPAMMKMMGKTNLTKPTVEAIMEDPVENEDGRRVFARVVVRKGTGKNGPHYYARLTGPQGSAVLTSMTSANGLAVVPEDRAKIEPGEKLQVMMLDWVQDL